MGWQRLVDSIKIQVFFAKEPHKRNLNFVKETYMCRELKLAQIFYEKSPTHHGKSPVY